MKYETLIYRLAGDLHDADEIQQTMAFDKWLARQVEGTEGCEVVSISWDVEFPKATVTFRYPLSAQPQSQTSLTVPDNTEVAMCAAFMWMAAFPIWAVEVRDADNEGPLGDASQTNWVYEVTKWAVLCEMRALAIEGFPSVWCYDVCEPFGEAIINAIIAKEAPLTEVEASAILEPIVLHFLNLFNEVRKT